MTPKTILIMLSSIAALLIVAAAAVKLKNRQSEYLLENYRLENENADLVTENIMLSETVNLEKCLE